MRLGERIALWIAAIVPIAFLLCIGLPWALRMQSAIADVRAEVSRQDAIDERLVQIYERVRKVQESIEKKFANEQGR